MKNTAKAIWALGAMVVMVVGLASTPAAAKERRPQGQDPRAGQKILEARRQTIEKAQKEQRKTIEVQAKARKNAAEDVAKARQKAAEAERKAAEARAKAAREVTRRPVVVTGRGGPLIQLGHRDDKSRVIVGLNLGGRDPHRRWVPGHYVTRTEQILLEPGRYEWRWQQVEVEPAHYETRYVPGVEEILYDSQGNPHTIVIEPGRTERVWVPARYELRRVNVWVPPQYETREVRLWVPGRWVYEPRPLPGLRLGAVIRF